MSKNPSDYPEWLEAHPLRMWRRAHSLSIPAAASQLGFDRNTVQFWETARRVPTLATLALLAERTGIPDLASHWGRWLESDPR